MTSTLSFTADVTFLTKAQGGRSHPAWNAREYRPHIVVGDPSQRKALVDESGASTEDYLGVSFRGDGTELTPGSSRSVALLADHNPKVNYDAVTPAATFTIREGGNVGGYGVVTARHEPR